MRNNLQTKQQIWHIEYWFRQIQDSLQTNEHFQVATLQLQGQLYFDE